MGYIQKLSDMSPSKRTTSINSLSDKRRKAVTDVSRPTYIKHDTWAIDPVDDPRTLKSNTKTKASSTEHLVKTVREVSWEKIDEAPDPAQYEAKWGWEVANPKLESYRNTRVRLQEGEPVQHLTSNTTSSKVRPNSNHSTSTVSHTVTCKSFTIDMTCFKWRSTLRWDYTWTRGGRIGSIVGVSASDPMISGRVIDTAPTWHYSSSVDEWTRDYSKRVKGFKQVKFASGPFKGILNDAYPSVTMEGNAEGEGDVISSSTGV
jgi:hypothetical protein